MLYIGFGWIVGIIGNQLYSGNTGLAIKLSIGLASLYFGYKKN